MSGNGRAWAQGAQPRQSPYAPALPTDAPRIVWVTVDERVAQGLHIRFLLTDGTRRRAWVPRHVLRDARYGFVVEPGAVSATDGGVRLGPSIALELVRRVAKDLQQGRGREIPSRAPTVPLPQSTGDALRRRAQQLTPSDVPTARLAGAMLQASRSPAVVSVAYDLSEAPTRVILRTHQAGLLMQIAALPTQPRELPGPPRRARPGLGVRGVVYLLYGVLLLGVAFTAGLLVVIAGVLSL